jgi:hypothetical protein
MATPQPRNRFWLYAPYAVVVAVVIGWTAFWFEVKARVTQGLDAWQAKESQAGRDWTCADRSIAGFPFRLEVKCASATLARTADASAPMVTSGPLHIVAQIYDPNHLIAEPKGPVTATWADGRKASLTWDSAQISLRRSSGQFARGSAVFGNAALALTGFEAGDGTSRASRAELHLRPAPGRAAEEAVDIALTLDKLAQTGLDQIFSNAAPADIKLEATLTQGAAFAGGVTPATLELWRVGGGALDVATLAMTKGPVMLEGKARLMLDELRRIRGRLDGAQSGIDTIAGMRVGAMLDAGALLAGRPATQAQGGRNLKPLPPLEARDGRLYLGPLRIPGAPLKPLY